MSEAKNEVKIIHVTASKDCWVSLVGGAVVSALAGGVPAAGGAAGAGAAAGASPAGGCASAAGARSGWFASGSLRRLASFALAGFTWRSRKKPIWCL